MRIDRKGLQAGMRVLAAMIGMATVLVTSGSQAHDSRWLGDGRISSGPKTD
jgi:hypothetical protein